MRLFNRIFGDAFSDFRRYFSTSSRDKLSASLFSSFAISFSSFSFSLSSCFNRSFVLVVIIPSCNAIKRLSMDFFVSHKRAFNKTERYRTDIYDIRDYYYDLSDSHIGLETPLKSYAESLNDVFSGKATSRKLFVSEMSEFTPYCRGGNTIIFNRRVLDIPNISPRFGDLIARRSDYFWVEQVKKNGFNIIGSSFATLHSKIKTDFEIEKEADKLLKDLLGSSFTKTIESELHESRESFYKTFKQIYTRARRKICASVSIKLSWCCAACCVVLRFKTWRVVGSHYGRYTS